MRGGTAGRVALYGAAIGVMAFGMLEALCRAGAVPNSTYRVARACRPGGAARRVLILGDSFAFDFDGSYGRLLAGDLRGRGADVVNLAIPGSGPLDYREQLERCAASFKPTIVVVNYYVGNDASDTSAALVRRAGIRGPVRRVVRSTYFGALILDTQARWVESRRLRAIGNREAGVDAAVNPFLIEAGRDYPDLIADNLLLESPAMALAWDANRLALHDIARLTRDSGGGLLVVICPSPLQVNSSHRQFYAGLGFRLEPRVFESDRPQRLLNDVCAQEHVACLDLLPAFRDRRSEELYVVNDDHWNDRGQALAFADVRQALRSLGWIP